MAQDATTVTPPNPTPPTNFSCVGATPPNPPNYTKTTMNDKYNWQSTAAGAGSSNPPPFYDDGSAGALTAIAAKTAALASGSGANAGGNENSYPGTGSPAYTSPNNVGAVPASTSADGEGRGTESVNTYTYPSYVYNPNGALQSVSVLGNYTTQPNQQHASSLSPATNPTLSNISPTSTTSGVGTISPLTATGVGFTKQSVIYVNGVAQVTTFVSSTSLTAVVTKKTSSGTWPVKVVTGGVVETAPQTLTFT
jgi:IPT/TIG domain